MLARLLLWRGVGEVSAFQSLDRKVCRRLGWAEGVGQHGIVLQRIQRLIEGCWKSPDVTSLPFVLVECGWINFNWGTRMHVLPDAI